MALTEINWNPTKRELRIFAFALGFFLCLVAAFVFKGAESTSVILTMLGVAVLLSATGYFFPHLMKPLYLTWMILFYPLRWLISYLLIVVVYYLVISPIGMALRFLGYDLIGRHFDQQNTSYWKTKQQGRKETDYFRQF